MKKKSIIVLVIIVLLIVLGVVYMNNSDVSAQYSFDLSSDTINNDAEISEHSEYYNNQQDLKQQYMDDINNNTYTAEEPKIILNPWDANLLSAYVIFETDEPVTFSYTVEGYEDEQDFYFESSSDYNDHLIIPVIGLYYGENTVNVSLTNEENVVSEYTYEIDTIGDTEIVEDLLKINIETASDEAMDLMDNTFVFSAKYHGYDTNGDLRFFTYNGRNQYYKYQNDSFYIVDGNGDADYMYKTDAMGLVKTEYLMPDGKVIHHDSTVDTSGNVYILSSPNSTINDSGEQIEGEEQIVETTIEKYDDNTGEHINSFDFYDYFDENPVVASGIEFDPLHINSVTYNEDDNTLIFSSQAQSMIFAVNADDYSLAWIIDEEEDILENEEYLLSNTSDEFVYTSGQHSAMINENPIYDSYREDGKLIVSTYNNNVCKDESGEEYKTDQNDGPFEYRDGCTYSPSDENPFAYDQSEVLVYAVDTENDTVEMLDEFILPSKSPIVSNVWTFDADDNYYDVFSGSAEVPSYYLIDENGEIIFEANFPVVDIEGGRGSNYRGRTINSEMFSDSISE